MSQLLGTIAKTHWVIKGRLRVVFTVGGLQLQALLKNIKASKHVFEFIRLPECNINFM